MKLILENWSKFLNEEDDENYDPVDALFDNTIEMEVQLNEDMGVVTIPLAFVVSLVGGGLVAAYLKGRSIKQAEELEQEARDELAILIETLKDDVVLLSKVKKFIALTIHLDGKKGKRSKELAEQRREHKTLSKEITHDISDKSSRYIQAQPNPEKTHVLIRYGKRLSDISESDIREMLKDLARQSLESEEAPVEAPEMSALDAIPDAEEEKDKKLRARMAQGMAT